MSCNSSTDGLNLADCFLLKSDGTTVASIYNNPAMLVNLIVRNLFLLAGVGLFIMIVFAGIKFAISPESAAKGEAKDQIKNAGIGFLIMFSAYWIIQIIQVLTGIDNLI